MKKLIFLVLALYSFVAEAQFVGGGGRRVTIITGGGDSSGTALPLTSQRVTTALGYVPLNPSIPVSDPAWITNISKAKVGLGNVDNTPDISKPLSTAAINALNAKLNIASLGTVNGQSLVGNNVSIVTNDASAFTTGTVPLARLPSDLVRNSAAAVFTNKTIDFALNTGSNLPESAIPTLAGTLAGKMAVFTPATINGVSVTSGSSLTFATPDATSITTGVFADARLSAAIARYTGAGTFTGKTLDGDDNTIRDLGQNAIKFLSDSLSKKINVNDLAVSVNGIPLRNGGAPITLPGGGGSTTDASALITGTLAEARLPATVVKTTTVQSNPSWLSVTPTFIGLGSVNNTADADKPISTAQAAVNAVKAGLSTANTYSGANTYTGAVTYAGSVAPSANNTQSLGSAGTRWANVYTSNALSGGNFTFGTTGANSSINLRFGTSGVNVWTVQPTTGNHSFYAPGAPPVDAGFGLDVQRNMRVTGGITVNPDSIQTFATNSAAIAGGVKPNKLYKTIGSDGEWLLKIAHVTGQVAAPTIAPVYSQNITTDTENANTLTFSGTSSEVQWRTQTPNKAWSMSKATNKGTKPFYRFEVRPDDQWSSDQAAGGATSTSTNSNWQNGGVKERSEFYQKYPETTPLDVPIWTSWSFLIEGDPTIDALNPANNAFDKYGAVFYGEPVPNKDFLCALGQWHGSPQSGAPHWALDLNTVYGKDSINLNTVGGTISGDGATKVKATFPISRNVWHNVVVRAVHSNDANVAVNGGAVVDGVNGGQISLWVDGKLIYEGTNIAMGYTNGSDAGYMKFGIYRTRITSTRTTRTAVQYANMEISTSDLTDRILNPLSLD